MANHEIKHCRRCNTPFECKVGSILICQCHGLTIAEAEKEYIRATYTDCLCRNCLLAIKHEMSTATTQSKIQVMPDQVKLKGK